jgi:hypothetical protein
VIGLGLGVFMSVRDRARVPNVSPLPPDQQR